MKYGIVWIHGLVKIGMFERRGECGKTHLPDMEDFIIFDHIPLFP